MPQGYNKLLVPPAVGGKRKLDLNMSVILVNILEIDIVGGLFRTRHVLDRQWYDPSLSYRNLDKDYRINLVSEEEEGEIWFPKMVFENQPSEEDTITYVHNQVYALMRNPENKFDPVGVAEIDNTNIYAGDLNKHYLRKEFSTVWTCEFNMKWYPFDTQECKMQYKIVNKYSDFAALVPALAYLIIPWVSEDAVPRANTSLLSAVYNYIFVSNILQQCPKFTVQHLNRRAVLRSITFVPICC